MAFEAMLLLELARAGISLLSGEVCRCPARIAAVAAN
jgi:hypothetical protein